MTSQKFKQLLLQILFVLILTVCTAFTVMLLWMVTHNYDNGWDGIAAALGGLMIGAMLGLVLSYIYLSKYGSSNLLRNILSLIIYFLIVIVLHRVYIFFRYPSNDINPVEVGHLLIY